GLSLLCASGPGACAAGGVAKSTPHDKTIAATQSPGHQSLLLMNSLLHLSQPPLGDEFNQNRFHLPPVEANPHDVEIGISRQPENFLLPLVDAVGKPLELAPRN